MSSKSAVVAERLEELLVLVGRDRRDAEHVAVVGRAHAGLHLAGVVRDALERDVHVGVLRRELLRVLVERAVGDEVGAPRHHLDVALHLAVDGVVCVACAAAAASAPASARPATASIASAPSVFLAM